MARVVALAVTAAVTAATGGAAGSGGPASHAPAAADPVADFPPFESSARRFVHQPALATQRALRLLAEQPGSPDAAEAFLAAADFHSGPSRWNRDGLAAVRLAVERDPFSAVRLLPRLWQAVRGPDERAAIEAVLAAARGGLGRLPRDEAAEVAYLVLRVESHFTRQDSSDWRSGRAALMKEYAGTRAAGLAELELSAHIATGSREAWSASVAGLEAFAERHAGTCLAAAGLRRLAWMLGHPSSKPGEDPAPEFLRVMEIVRQLDAPPYGGCPHDAVADPDGDAVRLVAGLYAYKPAYAPASIDRLLEAYGVFVASRFGADVSGLDDGVGYILVRKMGELFEAKGDRAGGIDRYLATLEASPAHRDQARFLRAVVRIPDPIWDSPTAGAPAGFPEGPAAALRDLQSTSSGPVARRALATLAWLHHVEGRPAEARALYRSFLERYPDSGFAWLAAVRAGQCAEALGDSTDAVAFYRAAARRTPEMPLAPVFGHVYAARALEGLGEAAAALEHYRAALSAWDALYGRNRSLPEPRRRRQTMSMARPEDPSALNRESVARRAAELARTTAAPGADTVERARWLIDHGRAEEGVRALDGFATHFSGSANAAEAAYLAHKGRLLHALAQLADPTGAARLEGEKALDALAAEPYDFPAGAAGVARAILLQQRGATEEADRVMRATLERWREGQRFEEPAGDVARDVAEIRRAVFQPLGGPAFGDQRWNAFSWPRALPPFLVVNADVTVGFADDRREAFSLALRYPAFGNVIGITSEQIDMLTKVMDALGGVAAREGKIFVDKGVMEAPVVPAGRSLDAIRFLATFFEARPGHWGGWEFLTYPAVTEIVFTNDARSAALARVVVGYGGCTVVLEKKDGAWTPVRLTGQWVT